MLCSIHLMQSKMYSGDEEGDDMGVTIAAEVTEYDYTDNSMQDMVLHGVYVGQYRNDVLAAFAMTADTVVVDFETYICSRLAKELNMTIESGADVTRAKDRCLKRWGQSIAEWSESWMQKEAHWELLER